MIAILSSYCEHDNFSWPLHLSFTFLLGVERSQMWTHSFGQGQLWSLRLSRGPETWQSAAVSPHSLTKHHHHNQRKPCSQTTAYQRVHSCWPPLADLLQMEENMVIYFMAVPAVPFWESQTAQRWALLCWRCSILQLCFRPQPQGNCAHPGLRFCVLKSTFGPSHWLLEQWRQQGP